jgi:hypothetical protein
MVLHGAWNANKSSLGNSHCTQAPAQAITAVGSVQDTVQWCGVKTDYVVQTSGRSYEHALLDPLAIF